KGQNNVWLMDADGKNPHTVFMEKTQRALSPVWTPDGNYIVIQRQGTRRESGPEFNWSLVMYHKSGGAGVELVGKDKAPGWHSISNDGKYLYFDVQACPPLPFGHTDPMLGCSQLRRINLQTRKIEEITGGKRNSRIAAEAAAEWRRKSLPTGDSLPLAGASPRAWYRTRVTPLARTWLAGLPRWRIRRCRFATTPSKQDSFAGKAVRPITSDWSSKPSANCG